MTARALGSGLRPGEWHNVEELLATLIEVVFEGHRLFFRAHAKKGSQPPPSITVPRPAPRFRETPPKEQSTAAEVAAFFGGRNVVINYTPKPSAEG